MKIRIHISTQYGKKKWDCTVGGGETQEEAVNRVLELADSFHGGVTLIEVENLTGEFK